jgi:ATP-binding cassette, subfamily B, multidrug efflux pump
MPIPAIVAPVRSDRKRAGVVEGLGIDLRTAPKILLRIIRHAGGYRGVLALAAISSLGATLFNILTPRLLGRAVDQAYALLKAGAVRPEVALRALSLTAFLLLAASALRGLLQMTSAYNSERLSQSVVRDLRLQFFEKLQRLDFGYHDRIHSGDLITRGMLDLEGMRGFIENGLQRMISLGLLLLVGSWVLLAQDWVLALITLSFVPFALWRAGRMGLHLRLAWTRLQESLGFVTLAMEENLQGARVVRAFPSYDHEMGKFDVAADEALLLSNRRIVIRSSSMATINVSYYLAMATVLWVGGKRVADGLITIGQLTEFLTFMTILQLPVRQIGMIMNSAARAVSSGGRVYQVLDSEPSIQDRPGALPLELKAGELRFENVSFAYDQDEGLPILQDISFNVGPGRTLGLVGASGAGKSTLAQLATRFYDVTAGRITVDGQDVRDITLESLRQAVNVVQQDIFLFDDSAERNIAYAEPAALRNEVRAAARTAHIHDHLAEQALGYESQVGERGSSLSGGQRQRMTIARGLMPSSAVLVFDNVTSAIDPVTEHGINQALAAATGDRAKIIISHRLSSLMHADEIIVLDAGRIVERGPTPASCAPAAITHGCISCRPRTSPGNRTSLRAKTHEYDGCSRPRRRKAGRPPPG